MSAKYSSDPEFSKLYEIFREFPPFDRSEAHTTADVRTLMFAICHPFELKAVNELLHITRVFLPALQKPLHHEDEKGCFDIVGIFTFNENFVMQDDVAKENKYTLLVTDAYWIGVLVACPPPVHEALIKQFYQGYYNERFFSSGEKECPIFCISDVFDAYPIMEVLFADHMRKVLKAAEA